MVLPGSCCSKLDDMWAELMGTGKILWFLAVHDHYTSSLPVCNLPFGVSSGDNYFPTTDAFAQGILCKTKWQVETEESCPDIYCVDLS